MDKKVYILDGNRFDDLHGFFAEISAVILPEVGWGRNLDAFVDILRGGFGLPDDGFIVVWKNSARSRRVLDDDLADGYTLFDWITNVFREHPHIELQLE